MEGFTLVLMISWLILIGCFVAMYFMDQATKKAAASRAKAAVEPQPAASRPAPSPKRR